MRSVEAERLVLARARAQHGVITSAQLAAAGLSAGWVQHRAARGWLDRVHRGVYLVGPLEAEHSLAMAATLAGGPAALISHYPAAVLWVLRPPREGPIDITVVGGDRRSRDGIRVHVVKTLHPQDITRRHGIPTTSAARTLLDLAATAPLRDVERAVNEAHVQHRISPHSLTEQFSRYPTHRGTAALKEAMRTEPRMTRSEAERLMLTLIRKARLPTPLTNTRIAAYEVDLLFPDHKLVVEYDSWTFHSTRHAFERDRRKDRDLQALGYTVLRFTWRELTDEPEAVVAAISRALAQR